MAKIKEQRQQSEQPNKNSSAPSNKEKGNKENKGKSNAKVDANLQSPQKKGSNVISLKTALQDAQKKKPLNQSKEKSAPTTVQNKSKSPPKKEPAAKAKTPPQKTVKKASGGTRNCCSCGCFLSVVLFACLGIGIGIGGAFYLTTQQMDFMTEHHIKIVSELEDKLRQITIKSSECEEEKDHAILEVKRSNEMLTNVQSSFDALKRRLKSSEEELKKGEQDSGRLKRGLQSSEDERRRLENLQTTNVNDLATLQKELETREKVLNTLEKESQAKDLEIKTRQEELSALKEELRAAKELHRESELSKTKLAESLRSVEEQLAQLQKAEKEG